MANYGHGGNAKAVSRNFNIDFNNIIDFSANINPLGMSEKAKDNIINSLKEVEKYPDIEYFELKKSISSYEKISAENIILGNGAVEVLFNTIRAIKPKKTLILAPTFSEYEEAVNIAGGETELYYLKEENNFKIHEDFIDKIDSRLDLIVICNPNNPTGVITSKDMLQKILDKADENNVKLIIDESFLDFLEDDYSMMRYINKYNNLIIVKSLTKFFAIPGLRIGYGIINNAELKNIIDEFTPAWNVNCLAEAAAKASLNDSDYIRNSIDYMNEERTYLYKELERINDITVFKPSVNFILLKNNSNIDLYAKLLEKGILIRSCSNYNGLSNKFYRIAVRSHEENKKIIKKIKEIFNE